MNKNNNFLTKKQSFLIKLNKIISRVYFENARNNCNVLPVPVVHNNATRLKNLKGPTLIK